MDERTGPVFTFSPVGRIHSPFREKFGIPRQSRLVSEIISNLEILPPYDCDEAFRGIDAFSHIWLIFVFHANENRPWRPTVRPPRLGGNQRTGVFSTRTGFRPNPIGLSAVELDGRFREGKKLFLRLKGADLLDQTPVLDIKPYLPYADAVPAALGGFAEHPPEILFEVVFTPEAKAFCRRRENADTPGLARSIRQILRLDPRPAYYRKHPVKREFGVRLFDFDVRWTVEEGTVVVIEIRELEAEG